MRAEATAAKMGDQVVMDFVGKVDGVAFDGGTGSDMAVEIGSGKLIPGFEDQLVGVKTGEEKTINVTFPADYQAEEPGRQGRDLRSDDHGGEDRRRERDRRRVRQVARPREPRKAARAAQGPDRAGA